MAILTDLPNELLLSIIADVSPVYIEPFALSCKRVYYLCADPIREYNFTRRKLVNLSDDELLRAFLLNPRLPLYPTLVKLGSRDYPCIRCAPDDLRIAMDIQIRQNRYADLLNPANTRCPFKYAILPLLITRLLNVRKLELTTAWCDDLREILSEIVEDSYEPDLALKEPLALGRLKDVHIMNPRNYLNDAMELAILFTMIPSLRTLRMGFLSGAVPQAFQPQHRPSSVTEIIVGPCISMRYLEDILSRITALKRFTYNYECRYRVIPLQPRRLNELLKQCAGQSLTYLSLLHQKAKWRGRPGGLSLARNHDDYSLGSLRGFTALRTLVTFVDVFIKTRNHGCGDQDEWITVGTGTMQRLVSWLPASLETLVLHRGLEEWNKDNLWVQEWNKNDLRMLFRGFRNSKEARLPSLKLINFVEFPDFDQVMPDHLKTSCREVGVKIGYTLHFCGTWCGRRLEDLQDWEQRPWVGKVAGDFCEHVSWMSSTEGI